MKKSRASFLSRLAPMAVAACIAGNSFGGGYPPPPAPSVLPPAGKPVEYECPRTKYIDCMPPVPEEKRLLCSPEYLKWIKEHCPDVEVVY
jgi:hypothetical protein